ncbi:MAG: hypothetical protein ACHQ49_17465, partial [Elusimicrobiota bacterium]
PLSAPALLAAPALAAPLLPAAALAAPVIAPAAPVAGPGPQALQSLERSAAGEKLAPSAPSGGTPSVERQASAGARVFAGERADLPELDAALPAGTERPAAARLEPSGPAVEAVDAENLDRVPPNVRAYLEKNGLKPIATARQTELRSFMARLAPFVRKLLTKEDTRDGAEEIRVVVLDDMNVNASFSKLDGGARVLTLNLGLLRFVASDDELAFVIGHELQHGPSELQAQIHSHRDGAVSAAFLGGLQRAVENEVDAKSLVRRVHEKGFNPHAATRFINRLTEAFGDSASATHTLNSSRRDTAGMAISALRRVAGEKVKEDKPEQYSRDMVGPVQDRLLRTKVFEENQRRRMRDALAFAENPAVAVYRDVRRGVSHGSDFRGGGSYDSIFNNGAREIQRHAAGLIDGKEWVDLQLSLHETLDRLYESARGAELGDGFKPATPAQLDALLAAEARSYSIDPWDIRGARKTITRLESDLRELKNDKRPEGVSLKIAKQRELAAARKEYAVARHAYVDSPGLDALVDEAVKEERNNVEGRERERYLALRAELNSKRRVVAALEERNQLRERRILADSVPVILRDFHDPRALPGNMSVYMGMKIQRFQQLPPELVKAHAQEAFREYLSAVAEYLDDAARKPGEGGKAVGVLSSWSNTGTPVRELFETYLEVDRAAALADFRRFYALLVRDSAGLDELEAVFAGIDPDAFRRVDHFAFAQTAVFSPEFAPLVLTREVVDGYLGRYLEALEAGVPAMSPDELRQRLVRFVKRAASLQEYKLADAGWLGERLLAGPVALMLDQAREEYSRALGRPVTRDQAKSLFYAQRPELYEMFRPHESLTIDGLLAELHGLARDPGRARGLVPFFNLARMTERFGPDADYGWALELAPLLDYQGYSWDYMAPRPEFNGATALDFFAWLRRRHPDRVDLMVLMMDERVNFMSHDRSFRRNFDSVSDGFFAERFDFHAARHADLPRREAVERAALEFWTEFSPWGGRGIDPDRHLKLLSRRLPEEPQARLEFVNGYMDGVARVPKSEEDARLWGTGDADDPSWKRFSVDWVTDFFKSDARLEAVRPETLADTVVKVLRYRGATSPKKDRLFERLWAETENRPEIRAALADAKLVNRLHYDENKKKLALWQLDEKFGVEAQKAELRARRRASPKKNAVRPDVIAIAHEIEVQFPEGSAVKNEIISHVQDALISNENETAFLGSKKIGLKNWYQARKLAVLDGPQSVDHLMESAYDRLELIKYLIGAQEQAPRFLYRRSRSRDDVEKGETALSVAKRHFAGADPLTRTYVLQPLLDPAKGALGEPAVFRDLTNLVLGDNAESPIVRALFDSYLESVADSEKKVILGYVLGSFVDGSKKAASLKIVLESMGPFGIKAGQFLRTSGLVPARLRKDLDDFLSRALPPQREEVIARFKEIFGDRLGRIFSIEELAGSGSINYVVTVELLNPETARRERAVVRFLRENAEGQIANENAVWESVIAKLSASEDAEQRRLGRILHEARRHAMETLRAGGVELDLEAERNAYPLARAAYGSPADRESGYSIEAGEPLAALQKLVPARFAKTVSIYRYVPNTPLESLPADVRSKLAARIVAAEFKALFRFGTFDPDGHPGNWLIDAGRRVLARIDYAQMRRLSDGDLRSLRDVLRALLQPRLGAGDVRVLADRFSDVFEVDGNPDGLAAVIQGVVARPDFPGFTAPHERLFFLRDEVERHYHGLGRADVLIRLNDGPRAAFASIARTQIYREHLSDEEYFVILLKALEINAPLMKLKIAEASGTASASQRLLLKATSFFSDRFSGSLAPARVK